MKSLRFKMKLGVNVVVTFLVLVGLTTTAFAQLGFKGIGGKAGFVMPKEGDNTFGFGVVADLGTIRPNLCIEGCVDYFGSSEEILMIKYSWSYITVGPTVKYRFPTDKNITPFAGAGVVFVRSTAEMELPLFGEVSASDTGVDFPLVCGVELPFEKNKFIVEARYLFDIEALWLTAAIMVKLR